MKFRTAALVCCIGCAGLPLSLASASQSPAADTRLGALIQDLHRADWQTHSEAFFKIVGPMEDEPPLTAKLNGGKPIPPEIRRALIDLLWRESKHQAVVAAEIARGNSTHLMNEDQSEYWAALNFAVGAVHDPAALDVLLNPTVFKGGVNNIASIGDLGEGILPRLLAEHDDVKDSGYRSGLDAIFSYMLDHKIIHSDENKSKLKVVFFGNSYSSDDVCRMVSLKGLRLLGDPASIQRVRDIAVNDPYAPADKHGRPTYPVRAQAN